MSLKQKRRKMPLPIEQVSFQFTKCGGKKISDLTQYYDIFTSAFSGISIFDAI